MSQNDSPSPAPVDNSALPDRPATGTEVVEGPDGLAPPGEAAGRSRGLGGPTRLLLALACAAIIIYGMRYAAGILNPILLALFITMGMSPILQWLQRKGAPPWLAVTVVLLAFVIIGFLFLGIMAASLSQLDDKLPVYKENLSNTMDSVSAWFSGRGIDISGLTSGAISPPKIVDFVSGLLRGVLNALSNIVLMILVAIFMISAAYSFPKRLMEKIKISPTFTRSFATFGDVTRSYLFTKTWLGLIVAVVVTIVYFIFGVDFALLWGVFFFILSFIPNIGFVLSVIPPFFVTLLEFGFTRAAIVVVIVIVMNAIVDNGLSPKIMGKSVGLSSLVVFVSLIIWGWVLGGIGALIAVPMTLMVKLLFFDSYPSTRYLSELLSVGVTGNGEGKKNKKKGTPAVAAAGESGEGE